MDLVVTGGAGFLGARLVASLLAAKDAGAPRPAFERIVSLDLAPCPTPDPRVASVIGSVDDEAALAEVIGPATGAVFHLAAVVSGQAEAEFETGMRVNLDGTRRLLDACRTRADRPLFFFASSLAVFGADCPPVVPDDQVLRPRSSYGTQKAMGELLVADASRRGFVDGIVGRLPTVVVRPGRPNAAASSFASSILREPMAGEMAVCPVDLDLPLWIGSPDATLRNIVALAALERGRLGDRVEVNLPGIETTPRAMLAALTEACGPEAAALVAHRPDPAIEAILASWPSRFDTARAESLGLVGDAGIGAIVAAHQRAMGL
ncbi:NAD-dependent epimerase/dehydratase family protein [Albimonas sp. CAU 1670]|uniref:D-erythronate dehydrogenase n=1 Tax=Albimonas sp. CAU 1670 TaxID=3032599 RepID=UPI0023DAC73E|nr:D-erythronate dehydrogenase [Albimonas sp. CAU 1670]MDF2231835.1 NAD-dependent epimerase/dehydratase family protein [Albimonas sp. CAU 1670]